jgi:hypothetical protein
MAIIIRREKPPKLNNYKKYKKYLRKDFNYKCVYCSIHEGDYGSYHNFVCEHFKPKSKIEFRHLKNIYENLLYSCQTCNRFKANKWPSDTMISKEFFFLNPCDVDFEDHFDLDKKNFQLIPKSNAAEYMIEKIHLNRRQLIVFRESQFLKQEIEKQLSDLHNSANNSVIKGKIEKISENFHKWDEKKYTPLSEEDMK